MKSIRELKNLKGRTVLLRSDLDAPHQGNRITDDFRIRASVPTIEYLERAGAKIIIISKDGHKTNDSLEIIAQRLAELLNKKLIVTENKIPDYDPSQLIFFKGSVRDSANREILANILAKDIVLLENIRNYPEETANDPAFGKMLAAMGDIYVDDAFAMAHRNEASVTGIPGHIPAYAGLNFEKEITNLTHLLKLKAKPFVVIIGGAKISDKIGTIENLGKQADQILIGGGPANLFFMAKGYSIGQSICEKGGLDLVKDLWRNFKNKIILPVDVLVANAKDYSGERICAPDQIKPDEAIFDIGPKTILEFARHIKKAKKMVWNGPMGLFENKMFSHGTIALVEIFASRCKGSAFGVVGGGDTLAALNQAKLAESIDFVSTAGGATLEFLANKKLPGVEALK